MTQHKTNQLASPPASRRLLPLLLLLFVGSGCSALIYEIVWFQLLQFVIGSSAVSLGVLLGTFMGGMCLGSLALPRLISPRRHPLRVYAYLELGIGLIGLLGLCCWFKTARRGERLTMTVLVTLSIVLAFGRYTPVYPFLFQWLPLCHVIRFPEKFFLVMSRNINVLSLSK